MSINQPSHEQAHTFGPSHLVGISSLPKEPAKTAVIVIVGGPQYRAGSHRQFVLLCRSLAQQGHLAFRFDYTGMGDTPGNLITFLSACGDIGEAVSFVKTTHPSVNRIVLWGLCDGASAALLYWHETRDPRIDGMCLLNPWVRSVASHAQTQVKHYYTQRLMQWEFWRKLLSGRVASNAVWELVRTVKTWWRSQSDHAKGTGSSAAEAPFQERMARAWQEFPGRILLITSGKDYTAKEFLETTRSQAAWRHALKRPHLERHTLEDADHTFSSRHDSRRVEDLTARWVAQL